MEGRRAKVKCYAKQEGLLDLAGAKAPHHYLVLAGHSAVAGSSRGAVRPLVIQTVHLFDANALHEAQRSRGVKLGLASSVRRADWNASEIYPKANERLLALTMEQREMLALFGAPTP